MMLNKMHSEKTGETLAMLQKKKIKNFLKQY